VRFMVRKMR